MNASELYKAGQLQAAIDAQIGEVKKAPADHAKRLFLFELLSFAGEWDRARRQIDVIKYEDPGLDAATSAYRALLDAEDARRRLFTDGKEPSFLSEPPASVRQRLEALSKLRAGQAQEAVAILNGLDETASALTGTLNGKPFTGLRDADDLFGTVLEVMAHGTYYWVLLEQVEALRFNAPKFPRDLIWLPARLEMPGAAGNVFLPTRYPSSETHADPQVRLGRVTDWLSKEGEPVRGVGLRTFLVGDDAVPLPEWRELVLTPSSGAAVP
jgi:type VI secretion system protein ImpE